MLCFSSLLTFVRSPRLHPVKFTSFLTPGDIYRADATDDGRFGDAILERRISVPGFDATEFQVKQEFYESRDGTR